MPEIKQIDWSKFSNISKVKVIKSKKVKRSRQEKLAIRDYYNTIDKIRATIKED